MEILYSFTYNASGWGALAVLPGLAGVAVFIYMLISLFDKKRDWNNVGIAFVVTSVLFVATYGLNVLYDKYEVKRHKVLISDMNKFNYAKYEIVTQEGKIFTIEELERE